MYSDKTTNAFFKKKKNNMNVDAFILLANERER